MLQQPLPLYKTADKTFEEFIAGDNTAVLRSVERWASGDGPWFVLLWGNPGVGKSHLLQAALRECSRNSQQAMYLPLRELSGGKADVLDGLDSLAVLGIDDLDLMIGDLRWETALFSMFNGLAENGRRLIIGTRQNPRFAPFQLPDLQSRLCSGLSFQLIELGDEEKKRYLLERAQQKDLAMPSAVADYIVTHHGRSLHDLSSLFERLDTATLAAGKPLTVPLVKAVINEQINRA